MNKGLLVFLGFFISRSILVHEDQRYFLPGPVFDFGKVAVFVVLRLRTFGAMAIFVETAFLALMFLNNRANE